MAIDPITGLPSSNVQNVYTGDKSVSNVPAPLPVVSATKIGNTIATPVPAPVLPTTNYAQLTQQAISGIQGSAEQALAQEAQQAQMEADRQKALISSQMSDFGQAQSALGGKAAETASLYGSTGVNNLAAQLRQLNAQATGLQNEAQAIPIANRMAYKGSAGTDNQVQNVNYDQLQQNALKALSLGQQAAIAKADYDTAKSYADQMVDAKYSQMEANLKSKEIQLNWAMKLNLEPAQKKAAEAKLRQYEAQKTAMEDKKEQEKAITDVGMTLSKYGVSEKVVNDVLSSRNLNEAIKKAGANLQDPKAKLELENMRVEQLVKRAEIAKVQRATALLGQKTPAETKAELLAIKNAKAGVPVLEDKMLLLDGILSSDAIDSVAGPTFLSRAAGGVSGIAGRFVTGAIPGAVAGSFAGPVGAGVGALVGGTALAAQGLKDVFGDRQNLIASVSQLTDKAFLDELLSLKERGGTLGQVTEREGQALKNAATRFGKWEIKDDKGNVIGYNVSEKDFRDEVEKMKKSTNRILTELRGSQYSADEQQVLDEIYNNNDVDPSAYFQ